MERGNQACASSAGIDKEVSGKIEEFGREFLETGLGRGEVCPVSSSLDQC